MGELINFLITSNKQFQSRARLAALYSDFRQLRTLNPDGYTANIEAWQKGLSDAAKEGHIPSRGCLNNLMILKVDDELLRALETKEWGRPLALGAVIREGIAKKTMIPLQEFMASKESIYHKSWTLTPWQILSWGLGQLGLTRSQHDEDQLLVGKFVILANVEDASEKLSRRTSSQTAMVDRIYSKKLFTQEFEHALNDKNPISGDDLEVLLKFMARDKGVLAYDGQTIKLKASSETEPPEITPADTTIASLKTLITNLESQINVLSMKSDKLSVTARDAVTKKNRVSALAALRSKKLAESQILRQSSLLSQLEEVYSKISQAADHVELVRVMEGSTGVLKALNKELGGIEKVDDIVDQLKNEMTIVDQVGNAIAEVSEANPVNETEIDDELEAMERKDSENKAQGQRVVKEEKERRDTEETRRRLETLGDADRAATARGEANKKASEARQLLQVSAEENVRKLEGLSL